MSTIKFQLSKMWMILIFILMMDFPYMTSSDELVIKLIIIFCSFIGIFYRFRIGSLIRNICPIILYFLSIAISAEINFGFSAPFYRAISYGVILISIYMTTYIAIKVNGKEEVFKFLFKVIGIIVLIMDMTVLATGGNGVDSSVYLANYLFGNKFVLAYFNMFFLSLYLMKYRYKAVFKKIVLSALMCFVCSVAGCATGIVGIISLLVLYIFGKKIKRIMMNKIFFFVSLAMSVIFVIFFELIISNNFVQYFITDILNRSLTLTGRMEIYQVLLPLVMGAGLFGYGHNNTAIVDLLGYGNAQNGIFNIYINYGILGIITFAILCYFSFKKMTYEEIDYIYPVTCFIYAMIICSTVEINLSNMFIFALALIRMSGGHINEGTLQGQCGNTSL